MNRGKGERPVRENASWSAFRTLRRAKQGALPHLGAHGMGLFLPVEEGV